MIVELCEMFDSTCLKGLTRAAARDELHSKKFSPSSTFPPKISSNQMQGNFFIEIQPYLMIQATNLFQPSGDLWIFLYLWT
jgi:hypothetical protein